MRYVVFDRSLRGEDDIVGQWGHDHWKEEGQGYQHAKYENTVIPSSYCKTREKRKISFYQMDVDESAISKMTITSKRIELQLRGWHHRAQRDETYLLDMSHLTLFPQERRQER